MNRIKILSAHKQQSHNKTTYDFLSNLVQKLTELFVTTHKFINSYINSEYCQQRKLIADIQANIINQQTLAFYHQSVNHNEFLTFQQYLSQLRINRRFISRITQLIYPIKHKIARGGDCEMLPVTISLIKEIEAGILCFLQKSKLDCLIKTIYVNFSTFLTCIKDITHFNQGQSISNPWIIEDKLQKEAMILKQEQTPKTKNYRIMSENQASSPIKKQTRPAPKNEISLGCLDIDEKYYRASHALASQSRDYVFENYTKRNKGIKASILNYSAEFKDYLANREKKQKKRLNFRQTTKRRSEAARSNKIIKSFVGESESQNVKRQRKTSLKINEDSQLIRAEPNKPNIRKTAYQMKNIVMQANQLKVWQKTEPQSVSIVEKRAKIRLKPKIYQPLLTQFYKIAVSVLGR